MGYRNCKGLTLIEVLISMVITMLVMLYGANLFIASWKFGVDSSEYNTVLHYVANQLEILRARYNSKDLAIGVQNIDVVLPSGRSANIKIRIYNNYKDNVIKDVNENKVPIGAIPVSVVARWPAKTDNSDPEEYVILAENNEKLETIAINTYVGSNFFEN